MTEDEVRDFTMRALFTHLGKPDSWRGEGKTAEFEFDRPGLRAQVAAERKLDYVLPGGKTLAHCSDVLISAEAGAGETRYISIEIKHTSAVTDQFKARSFDMRHLREQFGERIFGIMFFARAGQGISLEQARAISYAFDAFVGTDLLKTEPGHWWADLIEAVDRGCTRLANIGLQPTPPDGELGRRG